MVRLLKGGPVRLGDRTTGGGIVISAGGAGLFYIDGVPVVFVGDKATCEVHDGIQTFIEGCCGRKTNGLGWVLQGHLLSCGCSAISSCADSFWVEDCMPAASREAPARSNESSARSAVSAGVAATACAAGNHVIQFKLTDGATGAPLARQPVRVVADGKVSEQMTDEHGCTSVIYTGNAPKKVDCHVLGVDDLMSEGAHNG